MWQANLNICQRKVARAVEWVQTRRKVRINNCIFCCSVAYIVASRFSPSYQAIFTSKSIICIILRCILVYLQISRAVRQRRSVSCGMPANVSLLIESCDDAFLILCLESTTGQKLCKIEGHEHWICRSTRQKSAERQSFRTREAILANCTKMGVRCTCTVRANFMWLKYMSW